MLTLYIHACIHICTYCTPDVVYSAACPIPVPYRGRSTSYCLLQTLSPKGSRWVQLHTVSRWSGQEDVVHEGCHNLAGSLAKRSITADYRRGESGDFMKFLVSCNRRASLLRSSFDWSYNYNYKLIVCACESPFLHTIYIRHKSVYFLRKTKMAESLMWIFTARSFVVANLCTEQWQSNTARRTQYRGEPPSFWRHET